VAKVYVVLEIEGATANELRQAVHDYDEQMAPGEAIAVDKVNAYDVVGMIYGGHIAFNERVVESRIED
jgi:hypothetical protein